PYFSAKGPFRIFMFLTSFKYGVNFGGVIDISTYNPLFSSKYKTYVNLLLGAQTNHSGFKTKVAVGGTGNVFSYQLSGSWKKYDDYRDGDGNWVRSSLNQQSLAGIMAFRIASRHVVYGSVETSHGSDVDFPTLPMDERNDNTNIYSLNYLASKPFGSVNFIRFKAYLSDVHHEMDNKNRPFSDTVVAVSTIDARNTGGKLGINFNMGTSQVELGGDLEQIRKDGERIKNLILQPMLPRKAEDIWNNARITNLGIFAEYQHPGSVIDWVAAARLDFNSALSGNLLRTNMMGGEVYAEDETESSYANFSFSGGLTWHMTKTADLLFSLGRSSRSPDITERFIILLPIGYDPYDYLGNPGLLPEVNNEADLGIRLLTDRAGTFEVSTFFSFLQNFITGHVVPPSEIKPQTTGVLGVKRFINIDQAYMTGFELSYQSPLQYQWEISCNASYTAGWNPDATEYVFNADGTMEEKVLQNDPLPEIPPLDFNIHAGYKFFKNRLMPGISLRAVAPQNRTSEAFNERSTPGFVIFNLDVKYQLNDFLKIYAGIKNLFDNAYYEHLNRNIIGTSYPLYEPGRIFYANLIINF
ncbi:MAG: TonB-dependent receptor, partial [bacterium]